MNTVLPAGPYSDLAKHTGGVAKLAEALRVDRGTITRAAVAGRWLTGEPGARLKALCHAYKVTIPPGMKPEWV